MIVDEAGRPWLVLNGDPAYPLIRLLNTAGYVDIVLPAIVFCGIMTGEYRTDPMPLIRRTRLDDCLFTLEKAGVFDSPQPVLRPNDPAE